MSVRMRHTRAHTANRRSHHALKGAGLSKCSNCGEMRKMHTMCANCGMYKGRVVVDVKAQIAKKEEKRKARLNPDSKGHSHKGEAKEEATSGELDPTALSKK